MSIDAATNRSSDLYSCKYRRQIAYFLIYLLIRRAKRSVDRTQNGVRSNKPPLNQEAVQLTIKPVAQGTSMPSPTTAGSHLHPTCNNYHRYRIKWTTNPDSVNRESPPSPSPIMNESHDFIHSILNESVNQSLISQQIKNAGYHRHQFHGQQLSYQQQLNQQQLSNQSPSPSGVINSLHEPINGS